MDSNLNRTIYVLGEPEIVNYEYLTLKAAQIENETMIDYVIEPIPIYKITIEKVA